MPHAQPRRSVLSQIARTALPYSVIAAVAICIGESVTPHVAPETSQSGVMWLEGDHWWGPEHGRCAWCGSHLVPMVDEASACRYCKVCDVAYRHKSLPATLAEQEAVWR